ncbi:MAG: N-acetylmuramidase domain-containing protein [Hyphomicrobiales bacterium]|nr:N-acetylmuramidase domain-containing protein [Hyphomicrobiales bacterium]
MFTQTTSEEIRKVAREFAIEHAALLAVAEVESGGAVFATVDGRQEPLIRFEGHYFDRRLSGEELAIARAAGLASPQAGAVANPASQAARWRMLERAAAIDRKAAYESVSWGLGQVMGAHWAWLGFSSVDALAAETRGGAAGQARLMARYIEKAGLKQALEKRDWEAFARSYNGPAFRKYAYHTKLAAAYGRHAASASATKAEASSGGTISVLRRGAAGDAVRDLQRSLSALGYPVEVDGIFGADTDVAVRAFQRDHRLAVDGVAGPRTRGAIGKAMPFGGWLSRLTGWALKLFSGSRRVH